MVCLDDDCRRTHHALTVTGDGFATRTDLTAPTRQVPVIEPVSRDAFYVAWSKATRVVLRSDGTTTPVTADADPSPLAAGDVFIGAAHTFGKHWALDPETAELHRVPSPHGVHQIVAQPDGTLLGSILDWDSAATRATWSRDGGSEWREAVLETDEHPLTSMLPSARPGVLALVEGADGATLFPFVRLHRSLDGGTSWQTFDPPRRPRGYLTMAAVLPDGRLLVDIEAWSDQRANRPSSRPIGLHVSAGVDWSTLSPVELGAPFDADQSTAYDVVGLQTTADGVKVFAHPIADDGTTGDLWISQDGGEQWEPFAAR